MSFSLPTAGPIRRLLALVYDLLMMLAISLVYVLLVSFGNVAFTDTQIGEPVEVYQHLWYRLGFIVVNGAFFIYFWRHGGQTIGMRAWRLRLVNENGENPSLQQCLLRCLIAPLAVLLALIGYWWCWFDKESRALQDRLTKTHVLVLPKLKRDKEKKKD